MNSNEIIDHYVGGADLHDVIIIEVVRNDCEVIIYLKNMENWTFKVIFTGIKSVRSNKPETWFHSLSELKSQPPYRHFIFKNWDIEEDEAYLDIIAKSFKIDKKDSKFVPDTVSFMRQWIYSNRGLEYNPIENIDKAKSFNDAYVIMEEGRYAEFLLICPLHLIECNEKILHILLLDLIRIWNIDSNGMGAVIYYERLKPGDKLEGNNKVIITDDLWINERFRSLPLKKAIQQVVYGERLSIND